MMNSSDSYGSLKKFVIDGNDVDVEAVSVVSTVALTPTSSQNHMSVGDGFQIFNSSASSLTAQARFILPFGETTTDSDHGNDNDIDIDNDCADSSKYRRRTYSDDNSKLVTVKVNHECAVSSTCSRRYVERCTYALIFMILLRIQGGLLRELMITGERDGNNGERGEVSIQLPSGITKGELYSLQAPNLLTTSPNQNEAQNPQLMPKNKEKPGLHVVVSHCDEPLEWIWQECLKDDPFKSLTVLSKCGQPPKITDLFPKQDGNNTLGTSNAVVVELPNVGRWDHSYAYWIQQFWDSSNRNPLLIDIFGSMLPNDQVLFLNGGGSSSSNNNDGDGDRDRERQGLTDLSSMREKTTKVGFSCSLSSPTNIPQNMSLLRHRTEIPTILLEGTTLASYNIESAENTNSKKVFYAEHRPLKKWLNSLGKSVELQLTEYYVPVCFDSRRFMTTVKRILFAPVRDWTPIVKALALARGDNIEEARYMERLWAALLSLPIDLDEKVSLKDQPKRLIADGGKEYHGLVIFDSDKNAKPAKKEMSHVDMVPPPVPSAKNPAKKKSRVVRFDRERIIRKRRPKQSSPFQKGEMKKTS